MTFSLISRDITGPETIIAKGLSEDEAEARMQGKKPNHFQRTFKRREQ